MSAPEHFVTRWSRRKRKAIKPSKEAEARAAPSHPSPAGMGEETDIPRTPRAGTAVGGAPTEATVDLASLPSIDSITAATDIRAFLQSGVPAELTKAALRRVWTTDPAIRDFIGLAENQWDFTDPNAMPGFGPLEASDNVRELVAQAVGKVEEVTTPGPGLAEPLPALDNAPAARVSSRTHTGSQVSSQATENESATAGDDPVEAQDEVDFAASQQVTAPAETGPLPSRRPHGRALPE